MKQIIIDMGKATVEMTEAELTIVNNALNEVLNGIDDVELTTRIGTDATEIRTLLDDVNRVLNHHTLRQKPLP